jgi:DNA-binding beta-propeller fold protein YncE
MKKSIVSICLLLIAFLTQVSAQSGYQIVKTFHITSMGGWDYPAVDANSNKLYLSHGGQVNILDKITGDSIGIINNTSGVHGVAFVPSLGMGYTSNGKTNNVTVFDLKTGATLTQIEVGKNPDWIMYDPFSKKIVTSNHSGGDLSLIDINTNQVVATIAIGGTKLETVVSDEAGKLFVNLEDKNQIAEVDITKAAVTNIWDLSPSESPTGLAIDIKTKRLFSTCDKTLVVIDATNGKIVATVPIGEGCDGAAFDPASKLIFTSNGSGTLSVVKEVSANVFKLVETITTKRGARTISLDSKTHMVYLPTADYEPLPADAPKGTRAKMIPGSFQVLVLAPSKK